MARVRSKKRLAARIGDDGPHFAGELAEIARKEALMLPVQTGGLQKVVAVEIGADAHLDAFDEIHQDKARSCRM